MVLVLQQGLVVKFVMKGTTGRGAKPKAGLVGFSVSNLRIPGFEQPWEEDFGKPERIVTALDIMMEEYLGGRHLIMSLVVLRYWVTSVPMKKKLTAIMVKNYEATTNQLC